MYNHCSCIDFVHHTGSDCDEALEGCIPVLPEEVFDLVDEQTASESEEHKDTDSDATVCICSAVKPSCNHQTQGMAE